MRDKIAGYLEEAAQPVPARQILLDVLHIVSPNAFAADRVLRGILQADARFQESHGLWCLQAPQVRHPNDIAALHLEWHKSLPGCYRGAVFIPESGASWEFLRRDARAFPGLRSLRQARSKAENRLLLVWSGREQRAWNRLLRTGGLPEWKGETLTLTGLAARALPDGFPFHAAEDLSSVLDLAPPDMQRPLVVARFFAAAFQNLLDRIPEECRRNLAELKHWLAEGRPRVDFSRFAFDRDFLRRIPESPGVYLMRNRNGEVIYVGKASSLRRRVRSYFAPRALKEAKVVKIHGQLYSLEVLPCASEIDALLMEMRMIRDFRPQINLQVGVREQPQRYGRSLNLLILVPAGDNAEVYFLRNGEFVARHSVRLGRAPSKKLRSAIRAIFFGTVPGDAVAREFWEIEIVTRWLAARRKRLNYIDVDDAGSLDTVLGRLASYLKDPDRLAQKVYYR